MVDRRDHDTLGIDVGAPGKGRNLAFDPAAVVRSAGITIRWTWTGKGGPHNVEAEPADQSGESDYAFSSGDPTPAGGTTDEQVLDQPGIANDHCKLHLMIGMTGGIGVE